MKKILVGLAGLIALTALANAVWPTHVRVTRLGPGPKVWGARFYRTNFIRYLNYSRTHLYAYRALNGLGFTDKQLFAVQWKGQPILNRPGSISSSWPTFTLRSDSTNDIDLIGPGGKVMFHSQYAEWGDQFDLKWRYFPLIGGLTNTVFRLAEDETNCFAEVTIKP